MRVSIFIISFFLLSSVQLISAQNNVEEKEVKSAIETLFDGMRTNDSSKVASVFTRKAILQTVLVDENDETILNSGSLEAFLKAVGTDKSEIWDEQIKSYKIKIDDRLASAWTPYQFFRGEDFSHCGVNSFQLIKTGEGWKIFHIVDTRRKENCEI